MSNKDWLQKLKSQECPDATYAPESSPLVFAGGQGSLVYDSDGKEYIDLCSGFGVMAFGHNPDFAHKVFSREKLLMHAMGDVYPSQYKVELIDAILRRLPDYLTHGALAVTGSQAVEYAIKTAMLATHRSGIIALKGGYHGLDFGALTVSSREDFRAPFQSWLNADQVEFVDPEATETELQQAVERLQQRDFAPAAFIAEPIMGRAGIKPLSAEFLQSLRRVSYGCGALLIFDEIFCGYGRSGPFSFSTDFECDITCMGKPMGGGLPLSGFFAKNEVMQAWPESKGEAIHTGTFFGHALACQFGLEVLARLDAMTMPQHASAFEESTRLKIAAQPALQSWQLTGQGMMLALNSSQPGSGVRLMDKCRERGLIVLASGPQAEGISLTPAYNISDALMSRAIDLLAAAAGSL